MCCPGNWKILAVPFAWLFTACLFFIVMTLAKAYLSSAALNMQLMNMALKSREHEQELLQRRQEQQKLPDAAVSVTSFFTLHQANLITLVFYKAGRSSSERRVERRIRLAKLFLLVPLRPAFFLNNATTTLRSSNKLHDLTIFNGLAKFC